MTKKNKDLVQWAMALLKAEQDGRLDTMKAVREQLLRLARLLAGIGEVEKR